MKKFAIILGLAFSLAAMQSTFADDGSGVVSTKRAHHQVVCKVCGHTPCCCDKCTAKPWNYDKFNPKKQCCEHMSQCCEHMNQCCEHMSHHKSHHKNQ